MAATPGQLLQRIHRSQGVSAAPTIRETGVSVIQVGQMVDLGLDIPEILSLLPALEREDILAVMLFRSRSHGASVA